MTGHRARLARIVERVKREILADVHRGVLPSLPSSFSALHDHVDANLYGGLSEENADIGTDDLILIQETVQSWLIEQAIARTETWLATQKELTIVKIKIQPSTLPDLELPRPYYILENGDVDRQDYWRGNPAALVGFQDRFDVQRLDLLFHDWWQNPHSAVGKYPVFVRDDGDDDGLTFVQQIAIMEVTVFEDKSADAIDKPDTPDDGGPAGSTP